jgi:hypothetical protein
MNPDDVNPKQYVLAVDADLLWRSMLSLYTVEQLADELQRISRIQPGEHTLVVKEPCHESDAIIEEYADRINYHATRWATNEEGHKCYPL